MWMWMSIRSCGMGLETSNERVSHIEFLILLHWSSARYSRVCERNLNTIWVQPARPVGPTFGFTTRTPGK